MATLPNLDKTITKDPDPPATDTLLAPQTVSVGTVLLTTLIANKLIDNNNEIIDYISGDNAAAKISQTAIDGLVTSLSSKEDIVNKATDFSTINDILYPSVEAVSEQLAFKEDALGFVPEDVSNKVTTIGTPGNDVNYPTEKATRDALDLKEDSLGFTPEDSANKGEISGYAGLDASQELLLANFPAGTTLQILRRDVANTALEFFTIAAADISDFDTAVSANSDVTANTAKVTNATHTGDATGDVALTIANDAVTYAKIQNVAADNVLLGNISGVGGIVAELTGAQVNTILPVFTDVLNGLAPLSGGGTTNFLRADGTWDVPPGTGYDTIEDEGTPLTQRTVLNFIGSSVVAVDNTTQTDVTISAYDIVQDEGTPVTQRNIINFIGGEISVVDNAGSTRTDVTITANVGITTLNADVATVQTLTGGDGIDVTDVTPDHSFAVDSTVLRTTGAQTITGVKTFNENTLVIGDVGDNFIYEIKSSTLTASREALLPVLTANDTFAFLNVVQEFTNKTLDDATNTITGVFAITGLGTQSQALDMGSNNITDVANIQINATSSLFLDGGGDTSLQEQGADDVTLTVGGVQGFEWQEIGTEVNSIVGKLSALALAATDGFLHISSTPGTPTGVPTAYTGKAPLVFDSTNNLLYAFNSGWNVISGVKITTDSGTHVQATNTTEQEVLEILTNVNNVEVSMDFTELLQDTTVNVYEKMDATTYILISSATYSTTPVDSDFTGQAGVITLNGKGQDQRITLTSALAEAVARDVDFARVDVVRTE